MFTEDQLTQLLLGEEEIAFLLEVVLRTVFMFLLILVGLKLLGKRGVRQLSVFELVVIIGLGSAAGDPMFYKDVGLLPALIVFCMVILLYRLVTYLAGRSRVVEKLLEGEPVYLIEDGQFSIDDFKKEPLAQDEFFMELRLRNVTQLGQVDLALLETNGQLSVVYFEDKDVGYGLPIIPNEYKAQVRKIPEDGHYSCVFCGYTEQLEAGKTKTCKTCKKHTWVRSSNSKRVR